MEEKFPDIASRGFGGGSVLAARHGTHLFVRLNRPEEHNALGDRVLAALDEAFRTFAADDDLTAAVLTGSGDKTFAAGGNLKELNALKGLEAAAAFSRRTRAVFDVIRSFPVPVVAALNGNALGGGAELALACDFRIASRRAGIGFLQGNLAITTAWGGGIDLLNLLGPSRGLDLLLSGDNVPAVRAAEIGLVDGVAEEGETLGAAVDGFLARIGRRKPQVARGFKALVAAHRRGLSRAEMAAVETEHFAACWDHDDHWAAAEAALARMGKAKKETTDG